MKIKCFVIFVVGLMSLNLFAATGADCRSLLNEFIRKSERNEVASGLNLRWSEFQRKKFFQEVAAMGFNKEDQQIILESLNKGKKDMTPERAKEYLTFVLVLSNKQQKNGLRDMAYLDLKNNPSAKIKKFYKYEARVKNKSKFSKFTPKDEARYKELYYGCRALRPNKVNGNAANDFKRFNLSLGLGTLAASYAFYNMDKEKDAMWFAKLGYDIGVTVMFSYVGSAIQTKPTDTQITKSLKGYLSGRILGLTDVVFYPFLSNERGQAEKRLQALRKDPNFEKEYKKLLAAYQERGVYRKLKNAVIARAKMLPVVSLGVKGDSVDSNGVDWNNLSPSDLDREEVQEVLMLAAMAQIYEESKGELIETSDSGLDRYVYNSMYYGVMIPKSIVQNYITYQMLCMGQDRPKVAFTQAVLFNVVSGFLTNQVLFSWREKAINQ